MPNQSFVYNMLHDDALGVERLLAAAAEIGYRAVEFWGRDSVPFADIVKYAPKYGLRVATMVGGGGFNDPKNHDQLEVDVKAAIDIAADNDIPGLIVLSGNCAGMDKWTGLRNCAAGLRRLAPYAEAKGVNLNMELLNSKVDHADYMCDETLWAVTLCDLVGSPRVKILYDIYHMQIMEGDLCRTIERYGSYMGHYHTAGNPGRRDMDQYQEINYKAVMAAVDASGYELYVGHEFRPKGDDVVAALKAAFEACTP